jgi:hypothetical protein
MVLSDTDAGEQDHGDENDDAQDHHAHARSSDRSPAGDAARAGSRQSWSAPFAKGGGRGLATVA